MTMRILVALLLALTTSAGAQDSSPDPDQRYLILATHRTSTMQKELDVAAKQGYRVVAASYGRDEIILFLERQPPSAEPYAYRLLATHRNSTMEKELSDAGSEGFRFLPQTAIAKGDEGVVVMERAPQNDKRYEYRLLATHRTSTLMKEINEAARASFVLMDALDRDESLAVMERVSE